MCPNGTCVEQWGLGLMTLYMKTTYSDKNRLAYERTWQEIVPPWYCPSSQQGGIVPPAGKMDVKFVVAICLVVFLIVAVVSLSLAFMRIKRGAFRKSKARARKMQKYAAVPKNIRLSLRNTQYRLDLGALPTGMIGDSAISGPIWDDRSPTMM